jgi:hypothetical protein
MVTLLIHFWEVGVFYTKINDFLFTFDNNIDYFIY